MDIYEIINHRQSDRQYDPERPVEPEKIRRIPSLFCRKCKWISKKLYAIIKKKNMHFINKYIRKRDVYEKKIEV